MKDFYLAEDLNKLADSSLPFHEFYGKSIFITGATGLIGSFLVKTFLTMNSAKNAQIRIIVLVRNRQKLLDTLGTYATNEVTVYEGSIESMPPIAESIDYIIHAASVTSSKLFVDQPVETIMTSVVGVRNVLELARGKQVHGVVYLSSMEVFGITDPKLSSIKEADLGYIDIHHVRSSYSEGKRICELLCASYSHEYGVPVKIARLAQVFGAGIPYEENRVFAQFAKSVINGTDIILHTPGTSMGNYCYTRDAVAAILLLLLRGNAGEAYTIANPKSSMTIRDMAVMVAEKIALGKIHVIFDIPASELTFGYAPASTMRLNSDKMQALGWKPEVGLEEAYRRMIESMQNA